MQSNFLLPTSYLILNLSARDKGFHISSPHRRCRILNKENGIAWVKIRNHSDPLPVFRRGTTVGFAKQIVKMGTAGKSRLIYNFTYR